MASGASGFKLVLADAAPPLDREACDAYRATINASNAHGASVAIVSVRIDDANDAQVDSVHREDGGALDDVPGVGGTSFFTWAPPGVCGGATGGFTEFGAFSFDTVASTSYTRALYRVIRFFGRGGGRSQPSLSSSG